MIILDTHVWVWWASNPDLLSRAAEEAVHAGIAEDRLYVSSVSAWEVSLLTRKGRLELTTAVDDWIARSEALPFLRFVAVDNRIAIEANQLPGVIHDDPADRMIVATARILGATLITKDQRLREYPHVKTLW